MKKQPKHFFRKLFLTVLLLFSLLLYFGSKQVPVLMYHFIGTGAQANFNQLVVTRETFEKQINDLKKWGYRVYSLGEYYEIKSGRKKLPQKGVVITFDDGNRSFYEDVFPVLQRENIPVANFLIWDNVSIPKNGSMTLQEIKELLKNPLITFAAHTASHPILIGMDDARLEREVVQSKKQLEAALGVPMPYFSYPGGYFDDRAFQKVKEAGYLLAFTTARRRLEGRPETLHSLVRLKMTEKDANPLLFWFKVSGVYTVLKKVKSTAFYHFPPTDAISPAVE